MTIHHPLGFSPTKHCSTSLHLRSISLVSGGVGAWWLARCRDVLNEDFFILFHWWTLIWFYGLSHLYITLIFLHFYVWWILAQCVFGHVNFSRLYYLTASCPPYSKRTGRRWFHYPDQTSSDVYQGNSWRARSVVRRVSLTNCNTDFGKESIYHMISCDQLCPITV